MATAASGFTVADETYVDPYLSLWDSFSLHLEAEGRSPHTLRIYRRAVLAFREWLDREGRPIDPLKVAKADLQGFLGEVLRTRAQATARAHFVGLHAWFSWMEKEEVLERSPLHRMSAPRVNAQPMHVLDAEELGRLLKACGGATFEDRRDSALIRLAVDTGLRRAELTRLAVEDVDLRAGLLSVKVKGGDTELVPFGAKAARDLDRYLRMRARHRLAALKVERPKDQGGIGMELVRPLWLSPYGALSHDGVYAVVKRRTVQAGLDPEKVHVHTLRHSFAHSLKSGGASDEDVQRLGRWKDSKMVRRYGAQLSQQRAWETHRRLSPGDRL